MNAVEYLNQKSRMSKDCTIDCRSCPLVRYSTFTSCVALERHCPAKAVEIVEKWSNEHQVKTRQSEFLKLYPNVDTYEDGILAICPHRLDTTFEPIRGCYNTDCKYCMENYWLTEIE